MTAASTGVTVCSSRLCGACAPESTTWNGLEGFASSVWYTVPVMQLYSVAAPRTHPGTGRSAATADTTAMITLLCTVK